MKVGISNGFFDSLKKINSHQEWWYKVYEFIRYGIPRFLKNVWRFRNNLFEFYDWDYSYNLSIFKRSLEITADYIENKGLELDVSKLKKVAKMRRVIHLLDNVRGDDNIEKAEKELGALFLYDWDFEDEPDYPGRSRLIDNQTEEQKLHNSKVFARAQEIEESEWNELWQILKGQNNNDFTSFAKKLKDSSDDKTDTWDKWFDGSGIRGWWD